jgi:hypothetical protein
VWIGRRSSAFQRTVLDTRALFSVSFLVSYLVYPSALKIRAVCSSETSGNVYWTTRHHIPEDSTLHGLFCDVLKSNINNYDGESVNRSQKDKKRKAIPVTDRRDPYGCETSKLPHFLDNRLTDGGEVFSLMHWPPLTPRKIPGTHFC